MSATVFSRYCGTLTCNASAVVRVIVSPTTYLSVEANKYGRSYLSPKSSKHTDSAFAIYQAFGGRVHTYES